MTHSADRIIALVAHARDVAATDRRQFAQRVRGLPGTLALETCHRVELYAAVETDASELGRATPPAGGRVLRGEAAIRHAFAVAAGRDSVVVGEDQVLHQLREAVRAAQASDGLDPSLERLFASALRTGRRARSWRDRSPRSLADVAVDVLARSAGDLSTREILVVGAGKLGRLAVAAGIAAGASIAVTSRTGARASELARTTGSRLEDFDPGSRAGGYVGIVIALGGPWSISADAMDSLRAATTVVVDLSVPPAVPEQLARELGPRLTTADDLARADLAAHPLPNRTLTRLDSLIDRSAEEFIAWLGGRERRAAARALTERADLEREAELADLWRRLPDLDPEVRASIEGMSRHLAERLLRGPLERLGADRDGRHERAIRELWAL